MRLRIHPGTFVSVLAVGFVLTACSSSSPEPAAVSLDEYFQRVQTLHETQEGLSEAIGQHFAEQLSGDEANIDKMLAAFAEILPEFLPEFRVVFSETRDGLVEITPPAVAQDAHADLIAAYEEFLALIDRSLQQLDDGQQPTDVLNALFLDRSGTELGRRFSQIASELTAIADAAGIGGFVGGGALVVEPTGPDPVIDGGRVDDTPRIVVLTGVREVDNVIKAVLRFSGDFTPFESLLTYTTVGCTLELGAGRPPSAGRCPEPPRSKAPR